MAYIGNTATTQAFTPAVDYFNGDGSTVAFTLSKPVASVAQVQAVIENVPQNPGSAYTVSGNTITFTSAPPSGTANVYVYYTSPITQVIQPGEGTVGSSQLQSDLSLTGSLTVDGPSVISVNSSSDALRITQTGAGNALVVEDSANPDSTPVVINSAGKVVVGAATSYLSTITSAGSGLQVHAINSGVAQVACTSWATGTDTGATLSLCRSDSGAIGTQTLVGSSDVLGNIRFGGSDGTAFIEGAKISAVVDGTPGTNDMPTSLRFATTADGASSPTEQMRLDSSGNLKFNSGYGSVATAYGCRAWVNFNGTGTVAIRASGNVSSITDNGTGDYTVNMTTAMPDLNYAAVQNYQPTVSNNGSDSYVIEPTSTSSFRTEHYEDGTRRDSNYVAIAVFR